MERFAKRMMPECRCATRNYSGQIKISSKTSEKKALQGIILEFFLRDTLKTTCWMKNLAQRWTQSGPFFQKSGQFFRCPKRWGEASPLTLVPHLWVWLNMYQYPQISLNILENAWIYCSNYAKALNIYVHLTCPTDFWRCLGF